jgi:hypothetical protein
VEEEEKEHKNGNKTAPRKIITTVSLFLYVLNVAERINLNPLLSSTHWNAVKHSARCRVWGTENNDTQIN